MNEDLPGNKADFKESDTHEEKIRKHNKNVKETMEKAKKGETVNLTDLMIDKEELHIEETEQRRLESFITDAIMDVADIDDATRSDLQGVAQAKAKKIIKECEEVL